MRTEQDSEWGREALCAMVEIYLNPDSAALFQNSADAKGDASEHVAAAERLLREMVYKALYES